MQKNRAIRIFISNSKKKLNLLIIAIYGIIINPLFLSLKL